MHVALASAAPYVRMKKHVQVTGKYIISIYIYISDARIVEDNFRYAPIIITSLVLIIKKIVLYLWRSIIERWQTALHLRRALALIKFFLRSNKILIIIQGHNYTIKNTRENNKTKKNTKKPTTKKYTKIHKKYTEQNKHTKQNKTN